MTRHEPQAVKDGLKAKGWSQEAAAIELGKTFEHVNRVLNGHRESKRLLKQLHSLPRKRTAKA